MALINKTSIAAGKHPYQRAKFWLDEKNHFWETDSYTEKGKEICREHLERIRKENKRDTKNLTRNEL